MVRIDAHEANEDRPCPTTPTGGSEPAEAGRGRSAGAHGPGPLAVDAPATHLGGSSRLLLVPALNEARGLPATIGALREVGFRPGGSEPDVLVVDGHSTDGTVEVARGLGLRVLVQSGKGKGAAVRQGLEWGRSHGYRTVAVIDADGTYPPSALPGLFDLLEHGRDVVLGVRRPSRSPLASMRDLVHRIGNGLLVYAAAQLSGEPVLDICSGLWGLRLEALDRLTLESNGFEIEAELFVRAFRQGLTVAQFPVVYRPRVGEAKLHTVRDGSRILLTILRFAARGRPRRREAPAHVSLANELNAILLALGSERVLFLSDPGRCSEANALALELVQAAPNLEVARASTPPGAPPLFSAAWFPTASRVRAGTPAPVVVALPSRAELPGDPGAVLVGVPRSQRFLVVPDGGGRTGWTVARLPIAEDGFLPERLPRGRCGAWFILGAVLEPSGRRRELALLGANAGGAPFAVFRRARPAGLRLSAGSRTRGPSVPAWGRASAR